MRRLRWWAVWSAEYPEEGSLHVRATGEKAAVKKVRRDGLFGDMELSAARVTAAEHAEWEASLDEAGPEEW